jgi:hypothetical protein
VFTSPPLPLAHEYSHITARSLPRNQVPEWAASYIDYKGLKKLVKAASETASNGGQVDLAGRRLSCPAVRPVA